MFLLICVDVVVGQTDELSSKNGDGVLAPGGAVSNLYAVLAARHYAFPEIKKSGIRDGLRPAMVISKHVKLFKRYFFCM